MDWNRDGKEDWRDEFITQKLVSENKRKSSGGNGCLTVILEALAVVAVIAFVLFF